MKWERCRYWKGKLEGMRIDDLVTARQWQGVNHWGFQKGKWKVLTTKDRKSFQRKPYSSVTFFSLRSFSFSAGARVFDRRQ